MRAVLSRSSARYMFRDWVVLLAFGIPAYFIANWVLTDSGNLGFLTPVIVLGAFLVPVAFTLFIADHFRRDSVSLYALVMVFTVGGWLGMLLAGVVEFHTLQGFGFLGTVGHAAVEEGAKLLIPIAMFRVGRYRSNAAGVMIGVASGMGLAALESMSYALVALVRSFGDIGVVEEILFTRSLFAPAGHAAWTGLLCAVLWRNRNRGRNWYHYSFIAAFVGAVSLHTTWNVFVDDFFLIFNLGVLSVAVATVSYIVLMMQVKKAEVSTQLKPRTAAYPVGSADD